MQKSNGQRARWSPRSQWVQLGVLSATVVTPLLGRWNELRAAERARALRDEAEERLRGARALLPGSRREARRRMELAVRQVTEKVSSPSRSRRLSSTLWLAGAGVGLLAAGTAAYIVVRRQLEVDSDHPLVILPRPSRNGHDTSHASDAANGARPSTSTTATAAPAADRAVASLADRATTTDAAVSPTATDTATAEAPMGIEDPSQAKFIGNVKTMIYHDADADDLPAEENRVYFASEAEADLAGYRRDRAEVAPEAEAQPQPNE